MSGPAQEGIEFSVCEGRFCVAKLPQDANLEALSSAWPLSSITRDEDEVSIVADESFSWPGAQVERGWRRIKAKGPLDFELKGILLSLLDPLNEAGIGVFVLSTYSTDYVFVKAHQLDTAISALQRAGHRQIATGAG